MHMTTSNKLSRHWRKPAAFLAALGAALAALALASTAAMATVPGGQETYPRKS